MPFPANGQCFWKSRSESTVHATGQRTALAWEQQHERKRCVVVRVAS